MFKIIIVYHKVIRYIFKRVFLLVRRWIYRKNLWRIRIWGILRWVLKWTSWIINHLLLCCVLCLILSWRIIINYFFRCIILNCSIIDNIWSCKIIFDVRDFRILSIILYSRIVWNILLWRICSIINRIVINNRYTIINRNKKFFFRFFYQNSWSIISNRLNIRLINNFKSYLSSWTDSVFIRLIRIKW